MSNVALKYRKVAPLTIVGVGLSFGLALILNDVNVNTLSSVARTSPYLFALPLTAGAIFSYIFMSKYVEATFSTGIKFRKAYITAVVAQIGLALIPFSDKNLSLAVVHTILGILEVVMLVYLMVHFARHQPKLPLDLRLAVLKPLLMLVAVLGLICVFINELILFEFVFFGLFWCWMIRVAYLKPL